MSEIDEDQRAGAGLSNLHPASVSGAAEVRSLLKRAYRSNAVFYRAFNRQIDLEHASIVSIKSSTLVLQTNAFEPQRSDHVLLRFAVDGQPFLFQAKVERYGASGELEIAFPREIFLQERRSRDRTVSPTLIPEISIACNGVRVHPLTISDISPEGMAIEIPSQMVQRLGPEPDLVLQGPQRFNGWFARIRNYRGSSRPGWVRIGLELSPFPERPLERLHIRSLEGNTRLTRLVGTLAFASLALRATASKILSHEKGTAKSSTQLNLVEFADRSNRKLRGIIDAWGDPNQATAVVIPPGWGRTKETLMPLAATIVACFKRSRLPVTVLRFDGINKRGESHRDRECLESGQEHHHFTFSQGVEDIHSAVRFLTERKEGTPPRIVLVSFSASSIEARRAVSENPNIDGWISVVGSADLQSMMRSISGGIDFALGIERGIRFGLQEILGVTVNMDLAGLDALNNELVYLTDARREIAKIKVPITWIEGKHDAWMDKSRVADALSRGDTSNRRLIEVPTGHMLRNSRDALRVFQLIAAEIGRVSGLREIKRAVPSPSLLAKKRWAELQRITRNPTNLHAFWSDYLLGRDRSIGFELMTLTSSYQLMMEEQARKLELNPGDRILDLGCGTGALPIYLNFRQEHKTHQIIGIDFIRNALHRARERLGALSTTEFIVANLDASRPLRLPIASGTVDAVLASLLMSYLSDPSYLLSEARRVLRPGGRLVVSSLRPDADMSKLFEEGAAELKSRWDNEIARIAHGTEFETAIRAYMNAAARLLELEEHGLFRFFDSHELHSLVSEAGFRVNSVQPTFGKPPQAIVLAATNQ